MAVCYTKEIAIALENSKKITSEKIGTSGDCLNALLDKLNLYKYECKDMVDTYNSIVETIPDWYLKNIGFDCKYMLKFDTGSVSYSICYFVAPSSYNTNYYIMFDGNDWYFLVGREAHRTFDYRCRKKISDLIDSRKLFPISEDEVEPGIVKMPFTGDRPGGSIPCTYLQEYLEKFTSSIEQMLNDFWESVKKLDTSKYEDSEMVHIFKPCETEAKLTEADLKWELKDFPIEVVQKMMEYQVKQGYEPNVEVFQKMRVAGGSDNGFDWNDTPEGHPFWYDVIEEHNFERFFEKYPKK